MELTLAQQKYFAYWLTRSLPSDNLGKLTASLQDAQVDLTPHQIDAALFAFKSPLSKGAILADEVGLGKTIEAGIILSQFWAEHRRNINVWDAVMKNYENNLFYDYIFKPILSLEKYKLTKCSSNSRFDAKGYINRANMFETYLGGSVSVNEDMYSSIPLYEDYVSEGYKKLSMDNWKILPEQLDNIFQFFVGHINRIRGTELSSNGKFNVFFTSWNIWAFLMSSLKIVSPESSLKGVDKDTFLNQWDLKLSIFLIGIFFMKKFGNKWNLFKIWKSMN